jgi:rubrerythrin
MNIIETAIKMEQKAISFYGEAAEKTGHPSARGCFFPYSNNQNPKHCES